MFKLERRLFIGIVIFAVVIISRGPQSLRGDALHYVATSESLAHDFDLDLSNQYGAAVEGRPYTPADDAPLRRSRNGSLYPPPHIGLPLALTPVYLAAEAAASALPDGLLQALRWNRANAFRDILSLAMVLLYAWTAVLTLRIAKRLRPDGRAATAATIVAFMTPPLLTMSFLVFPEVPAAFLGVWFLGEQLRRQPRPLVRFVPLALLPWLHPDYVAISALGIGWILWRDRRAPGGWRALAPGAAIPLASALAYALLSWWTSAANEGPPVPSWGLALVVTGAARGFAGLLMDHDFGLLTIAPFWAFAFVGAARLRHTVAGYVAFASTVFFSLSCLAAFSGEWWGGYSPPARLLVPALPLLVPMLAEGFGSVARGPRRWLLYAAVGWAATLTVVFVDKPINLWTDPRASRGLMAAAFDRFGESPTEAPVLDVEAFMRAVREGDLESVVAAVDRGIDPARGLDEAARNNRPEVLSFLLDKGAGGLDAARALAWTRARHDPVGTGILEAAGVDVNAANEFGETALIFALKSGALAQAELLLDNGADPNAATRTGTTPLLAAVTSRNEDMVAAVVAAGAAIDAVDRDGWTTLLAAASDGSTEIVALLIDAGADVDRASELGWTPLLSASYAGNTGVVELLLGADADVDFRSQVGKTPLIRAAQRGHLEIVAILLRAGADPTLRSEGLDALAWARLGGHDEAAAVLEGALADG
ncbi:MAG TPA: ankyrin repeat domain-containing protein [Acidobacteriota bacterium]